LAVFATAPGTAQVVRVSEADAPVEGP
jgi:hypothetical protein